MSMNTCRVCKVAVYGPEPKLIKYSVRHYAHPECALNRWGAAFFDRLTDWQLTRFPAMAAAEAGLFDELVRRAKEADQRMSAEAA